MLNREDWLPHADWQDWEEAFKTSYREYVQNQHEKDMAVYAVRDAVGRLENVQSLATPWINGLKIHAAALPPGGIYGYDRQSPRRSLPGQRLESDGMLRRTGRVPPYPDSAAIDA